MLCGNGSVVECMVCLATYSNLESGWICPQVYGAGSLGWSNICLG